MTDYYKEDDIDEQLNLDSEEATQFHFFRLHDYDSNNKLDGLELYVAITHFVSKHAEKTGGSPVHLQEAAMEQGINRILEKDDKNEDGFLDYYEFVQSQIVGLATDEEQNNL